MAAGEFLIIIDLGVGFHKEGTRLLELGFDLTQLATSNPVRAGSSSLCMKDQSSRSSVCESTRDFHTLPYPNSKIARVLETQDAAEQKLLFVPELAAACSRFSRSDLCVCKAASVLSCAHN